jgi:multiple sugar transport system permease protein
MGASAVKLTLRRRQILWAYLFLSVSLVFFITIRWYPTLLAFNISFRDWNVFQGAGPWVGLANYADIWEDFQKPRSADPRGVLEHGALRAFRRAAAIDAGAERGAAAQPDSRAGRLFPRRLLRAFCHLGGGRGLCVELAVRAAGGLLNQLLKAVGLPMQQFLRDPALALPSITVVAVWRSIGFAIIIFLAGLQQIPDIYYEAAQIDGANPWQMFWRITLPLLNPVIVYLAVLQTIEFLRMFDLVQNMTQGGPLNRTTTVVLEVYNEGFSSYNMGYAAALTVILFGLILLITVVQLRFLSRRVEY